MIGNMTVRQYASKFTELSRFASDFVASEWMKMRRFEEGFAFYIRNQLTGQPIKTYQELYERVAEVECVKSELRMLNPGNPKRKWDDHGTSSNTMTSKKPTTSFVKSCTTGPSEPCGKCGRTNHHTSECRIGTNQCFWCGSTEHAIIACPKRLRAVEKGAAKPLAPPRQMPAPQRPPTVGRAYIMSRKEASNSGTVVTVTLFLNSTPFSVLFDSGATYSFISTRAALLLSLEGTKEEVDYQIGLPNNQVIKCLILYKDVPIMIGEGRFLGDLIQFNLSEFDIILGMNWLTTHGRHIDCKALKVILKDSKGRKVYFHGE